MFILYALKTFFRKFLSSFLLTLLLAATSILLCLSLGLSYAADIICRNLDNFHTTLAIIQPGPQRTDYGNGENLEFSTAERNYENMIEALFEDNIFENVVKVDRRRTMMGVVESLNALTVFQTTGQYHLQNGDFDSPNNMAILVIEYTDAGVQDESGTRGSVYTVTDVIAMHDAYQPIESVYPVMPYTVSSESWGEGEKYLVCAMIEEGTSNISDERFVRVHINTPTDVNCELSEDGATVYGLANFGIVTVDGVRTRVGDKLPIMTRLDVPLAEFWNTEIGKEWMASTIPYIENHINALHVTGTDYVEGIQYFNNGKARLEEGRYINSEEYRDGLDVCMVSKSLADANGWSLGDQISMDIYQSKKANNTSNGVGQFAKYQPTRLMLKYNEPVKEHKTYTIVGLYQTENVVIGDQYYINPNTVFVPNNSLHAEYEFGVADANRLSIVIPNGKLDAFKAEAEELGYGDFFLYNDQGYSAVADTLLAIQESAGSILNMSLGLWIFSLLLVVFLFLLMQRKYAATMWQLGCKKGNIFVYILTQLGVLSVISAVIAFVGSNALYEKVVTWMISGNISQFDDAFSALSTSGGTVEEVMGYLTQSPETFAKIVALQLIVFLALFTLSACIFAGSKTYIVKKAVP